MQFSFTKLEAQKLWDLVDLQYGYQPEGAELEMLNALINKLNKAYGG